MKSFFLSALFIISSFSYGQVWIDNNATWHYKVLEVNYNPGYQEYTYTRDTVILGQVCQVIDFSSYFYSWVDGSWSLNGPYTSAPSMTYVSGDTVFYYFHEQFFTLFNFGASIGDEWIIADTIASDCTNCKDTSRVKVVDTGILNINAYDYRTITLETVDSSSYGLNGIYIERFGSLADSYHINLVPRPLSCDPSCILSLDTCSFACFEDDSFLLYNPTGEDCIYYPPTDNINEEFQNSLSLFPNPATDILNVKGTQKGTIYILNMDGKEVLKSEYANEIQLDVSTLPAGTYFFLLSQGDKMIDIQKFTKL